MIPLLVLAAIYMRSLKGGDNPPTTPAAYRAAAVSNSSDLATALNRPLKNLSDTLDLLARAVHEGKTFAEVAPELAAKMAPMVKNRLEAALAG